MDRPPEYSLFLSRILSELDTKRSRASYQELCQSLCSRFDLVHLAKLRSLLFHTASLDPAFPTSLYREKMCCSTEDPQSKKQMVAEDIVSMFNLIQNGSPGKGKLSTAQAPFNKNHSMELQVYEPQRHHPQPQHYSPAQTAPPCTRSPLVNSHHQFIPTTEPNFLLCVNKDLKCRAASLDKLHHLPYYSTGTPLSSLCEMQRTHFPRQVDSDPTTEHSGCQEPFSVHSCVHKRNLFKEDLHNRGAISPKAIRQGSESAEGYRQKDFHKPAVFFNHSFELPYNNPYVEPGLNSTLQEQQRIKHESLDDIQASTYFGPTTVSESISSCKHSDKSGKQLVWPVKSLSLNTDYGPPHCDPPFLNKKPLKEMHHPNMRLINNEKEQTKVVASPAFTKKADVLKSKDLIPTLNGPRCPDKRDEVKQLNGKILNNPSFQRGDSCSSVGTQTEKSTEQKRLKEFCDRERPALKRSEEDSELICDDISDIFRFLDDMSVCDSLGVVQSSCYNSNGSLSQLTLRSEGDSSPERSTVRLAKSKLDSLFQSLENSDDELKANVYKLVVRMGEIEKKLESLTGVRSEISQLLSKLNQLDQKIHKPDASGRVREGTSAKSTDKAPPHSETGLPTRVFQCHTTGHNGRMESGPSGDWSGTSDSLRVQALKNSMMRRSSHSLNEDMAHSLSDSFRDWSTVSYCRPGDLSTDRDWPRKNREPECDRQYEPLGHRAPTKAFRTPQAYTPSMKSPLYTDLRLSSVSHGKQVHPSRTFEKYKQHRDQKGHQLKALDLQAQDSLNPTKLEYWLEDVYTPGYDSLLRRKQAQFRRTKVCKMGALIVAATCTIILVIVVPICTMRT